jgi:hypothetical protein
VLAAPLSVSFAVGEIRMSNPVNREAVAESLITPFTTVVPVPPNRKYEVPANAVSKLAKSPLNVSAAPDSIKFITIAGFALFEFARFKTVAAVNVMEFTPPKVI